MADEEDASVGSGSMEATPALDRAHPASRAGVAHRGARFEPTEVAPISLGQRLSQPRTFLSIVVPLAIIGFFLYLIRERLAEVPTDPSGHPALVLLAAFVSTLAFRSWLSLAAAAARDGLLIGLRNSTEILHLSWFVNCVAGQLGDVYRAYLLKMNSPASLSRTFGTVFIERILDISAIAILGLAAGFWSFRDGMPPAIRAVFVVGIVTVIVAAVGPLHDAQLRSPDLMRLPLPPTAAGAVRTVRRGRLRCRRPPASARARDRDRPDLADGGSAALHRRARLRLPGRGARPVGRDLRRADRLAVDGDPAQPGRARLRPGGRHRRPDRRLRRAASRSDGDQQPLDWVYQRVVDHRVRRGHLCRLADAPRDRPHRATDRRSTSPFAGFATPGPV